MALPPLVKDAVSPDPSVQHEYYPVALAMSLLGGLAVAIGPFLTWAKVEGIVSASVSGIKKTNNEAYVLVVLGLVVAGLAAFNLAKKANRLLRVSLGATGISCAMTMIYFNSINEQLSGKSSALAKVSMGFGLFVCAGGCALMILAAYLGRSKSSLPPKA